MAKIQRGKRYNNLDSMIADLQSQVNDFEACEFIDVETDEDISDSCEVESAEELETDENEKPSEEYIAALQYALDKDLTKDTDNIVYSTTDSSIVIIITKGDDIQEFDVPFADLTKDEGTLSQDTEYIEDAVYSWINVE